MIIFGWFAVIVFGASLIPIFAMAVMILYTMHRHLDRMDQAIYGNKCFLHNDFHSRCQRVMIYANSCGWRFYARRAKVPLDKLDALDPQLKRPFLVVFWLFTAGSSLFLLGLLLLYILENYTQR